MPDATTPDPAATPPAPAAPPLRYAPLQALYPELCGQICRLEACWLAIMGAWIRQGYSWGFESENAGYVPFGVIDERRCYACTDLALACDLAATGSLKGGGGRLLTFAHRYRMALAPFARFFGSDEQQEDPELEAYCEEAYRADTKALRADSEALRAEYRVYRDRVEAEIEAGFAASAVH